jgi:hypothetical protein
VTEHTFTATLNRPAAVTQAVLGTRPASWLRPFLRLAVRNSAPRSTAGQRAQSAWYRLSQPVQIATNATSANLTWWPHVSGSTFQCFHGQFTVTTTHAGSSLSLSGVATGGQQAHNAAAIRDLVNLLASAVYG